MFELKEISRNSGMRLLLFVFILFYTIRIASGQTINYQLVDLTQNPQEVNAPQSSLIDSLGFFSKPIKAIVEGVGLELNNGKLWIGNVGLWSTVPVYNFVDGFWLGQTFKISYRPSSDHHLTFLPFIYYTTARRKLVWQTELIYEYAPETKGKLTFNAGDISADYDTEEHLARLENSLYSLVLGRNYMKLFRKRFIELKNNFYPFPGFRLYSGFSLQWRNSEENHTTYSFITDHDDQSNVPFNRKFRPMLSNVAFIGDIGFDYTPCIYCVFNKGSNEIIYSHIPTLSLRFGFGLPMGSTNRSSYNRIEGAIHQRFKFKEKNTFHYKVGVGTYLSKNNLWFPDFRHFGAYSLPSMRTFTEDGYFLIGYYKADTDGSWLKGSVNFMSEHFLLTRLPFLNKGDFSEGMHGRYLWTSAIRHYTEWGYSIGFKDFVRLGAFIGFEGSNYSNFGVSLSFPWLTGGY